MGIANIQAHVCNETMNKEIMCIYYGSWKEIN